MKSTISAWQKANFIFTAIAGVMLHFLFEWTNKNVIVASFSAVNESTWEHLKLLFFPMLIFAFIQNRYIGKQYNSFWCVKLIGILSGVLVIPVLFYTINGVFGTTPDWVNIAIFFVAVLFSSILEAKLLKEDKINCVSSTGAVLILCLVALLFVVFTFVPPHIPVFQDPITGGYGI